MAYTIVKSDGTVLTTIADGTINTTSTTLGLPGRNYAGYGQSLDTNFVHQLENFAYGSPPSNPLKGQLWFNTTANTLNVCPLDGTANANAWLVLTTTSSSGNTTFGNITVTGLANVNILNAATSIIGDTIDVRLATVRDTATILNANITTANVGNLLTTLITTGATTTNGNIIGAWTLNGSVSGGPTNGSSLNVNTGYVYANGGIKVNTIYDLGGNLYITPTSITTTNITTGASGSAGTITGNWTLTAGSRMAATYADLAERFESDAEYDAGTVVELGGEKEITAVQHDLSEDIFGVVSSTAAYLMNASAGDDKTHPPVAMSGRVKVKVMGKIKKNDRLVSAGNGRARAAAKGEATAFNTIGRSLVNKNDDIAGTVEAIVTIK